MSNIFITEILERNTGQFESSMRNIREHFDNNVKMNEKITTAKINLIQSNISNVKITDDVLKSGDSFRLRSLKFPDYEMGVTSVKLKDQFCKLGLREFVKVCIIIALYVCICRDMYIYICIIYEILSKILTKIE